MFKSLINYFKKDKKKSSEQKMVVYAGQTTCDRNLSLFPISGSASFIGKKRYRYFSI